MGRENADPSIPAARSQPGGNITGFAIFEATLGGKWLELLSEIAPGSSGPQSCSIPTRPPYRLFPHLRAVAETSAIGATMYDRAAVSGR
jgi:putative ABC transport system substrate-binding protein